MPTEFTIHLPSNVQPNRFPNNTAAVYSTQLQQPISLEGEWEVALVEISYPNSINLFRNSGFRFTTEKRDLCLIDPSEGGYLKRFHFALTEPFTADTVCSEMNDQSDGVFTLSHEEGKTFKLDIHKTNKMLRLSSSLSSLLNFGLSDFVKGTYISKKIDWSNKPALEHWFFVSTDACFIKKVIPVKLDKGQLTTLKDLKIVLQSVSSPYFKFNVEKGRVTWTKKKVEYDPPIVIKMNKIMRNALGFTKSEGFLHAGMEKQMSDVLTEGMIFGNAPWNVFVYLHQPPVPNVTLFHDKQLISPRTHQMNDVLASINEWSREFKYKFEALRDGKLKLTLRGINGLVMNENVSRILGFTQTVFQASQSYIGTYPIALYNNIDYVFVYSNICDHVNVGHMKSPMLHALPFQPSQSGKLVHHTITHPIYRPFIGNTLERIDMRLCDDNGENIDFGEGKTMVVLRLRRKLF